MTPEKREEMRAACAAADFPTGPAQARAWLTEALEEIDRLEAGAPTTVNVLSVLRDLIGDEVMHAHDIDMREDGSRAPLEVALMAWRDAGCPGAWTGDAAEKLVGVLNVARRIVDAGSSRDALDQCADLLEAFDALDAATGRAS